MAQRRKNVAVVAFDLLLGSLRGMLVRSPYYKGFRKELL